MSNKQLYVIFFALLSFNLFALTYRPMSFEKQLEEADGIIEGLFLSMNYKQDKNGATVTVLSFKVKKYIGLRTNEVLSHNNFQIIMPGGIWQGEINHVFGTPNFKKNKPIVLLVKKGKFGFRLNNFGLAKYKIKYHEGQKYLSSSVFPAHSELGNISYEEYENKAMKRFNNNFVKFYDGKKFAVLKKNGSKNEITRIPASVIIKQSKKEDTKKNNMSIFWLLLIFSSMGVGAYFIRDKL